VPIIRVNILAALFVRDALCRGLGLHALELFSTFLRSGQGEAAQTCSRLLEVEDLNPSPYRRDKFL